MLNAVNLADMLFQPTILFQVRLDFLDFQLQPPILGDCRFDKMFTLSGSGNDYPILCGWNGGHHMYLDVADRAATDLTFVIKQLKEELEGRLRRQNLKLTEFHENRIASNVVK